MRKVYLIILGAFCVASALVFLVVPTRAGSITVTNTNDAGAGSLRQAILDAGVGDTIDFNLSYPATITLTSGQLIINKNLTISGPGANNLTISGNDSNRVILIEEGVTVTISDVKIADGLADYGGSGDDGGGIYNQGSLTLVRCVIANNFAGWDGGGVFNDINSVFVLQESTLFDNQAEYGGGVKNQSATATIVNSTFFNNSADTRGGAMDSGYKSGYPNSNVSITNCTIIDNAALIAGGLGNPASKTTSKNTIVAENLGGNCDYSPFQSASSNNLATDDSCGIDFTQVISTQLALGELTGNLPYYPIETGSVAIDTGTNSGCPATDQRGAARPQDGDNNGSAICDIGAYEKGMIPPDEIIEYQIPTDNSHPYGIAADNENNLWFTESAANKIGKLTYSGSRQSFNEQIQADITEFIIPTSASTPSDIVLGPDGNLWFTENAGNKIGKITSAGVITEYTLPNSNSGPIAITVGADDNLWFCEEAGNRIGKMNTSGVLLNEYQIPTSDSELNDIVSGPDGNLWFTEYSGMRVGKITTSGNITEYNVVDKAFGITAGADGNLWFTLTLADRVGKITPSGSITYYDLPGDDNGPLGIVAGPYNQLWITANFTNKILRLLLSGDVLSEYAIPTSSSNAQFMTVSPDGRIWFTEMDGNQIGEIIPRGGNQYLPAILK